MGRPFMPARRGRGGLLAAVVRFLLGVVATVVLLAAVAWGAAALWFDGPRPPWLAAALAAAFPLLCVALLIQVRPYRRALLATALVFGVLVGWWLSIPARNDRDWLPDVARPATANIEGNRLTVHNVRDFVYRTETDYDERWDTRTYDLDQLEGMDLFLCFWGPTEIAHTITSWEFADGSHLAVSIETRKEKGESYSAVRGFFRQFELYYVVADERDVVGLRTNYRGEEVYRYRLRGSPELARAMLLDYMQEINRLAAHPRWYNALTHNCTTAIRYHTRHVGAAKALDWRLFANGHLPELLYERGRIDTDLPLAELVQRSDITGKAKAAGRAGQFSELIREGLPAAR